MPPLDPANHARLNPNAYALRFQASFYETEPSAAAAVNTARAVSPVADGATGASRERISYSRERYVNDVQFAQHPDFTDFKQQFVEGFARMEAFCAPHELPAMRAAFDSFLSRRFAPENNNFFFHGPPGELLDGPGKRAFDEMLQMLSDPGIDQEDKKAAVRNLAAGLGVCGPGVGTHMITISRDLAMSCGGLRAAVWQGKERIAEAEISEAVWRAHGNDPLFALNAIHYSNAVRNYLSTQFGMLPIHDSLAPTRLDMHLLQSCGARLESALTPPRLALHLAEVCTQQFAQTLEQFGALQPTEVAGTYQLSPHAQEVIDSAMAQARKRFGNALAQSSLVRMNEETLASFTLQPKELVATDILQGMREQNLLAGVPAKLASWTDSEGLRTTAYRAGSAWTWLERGDARHELRHGDGTGLQTRPDAERTLPDIAAARLLAVGLPSETTAHRRRPSFATTVMPSHFESSHLKAARALQTALPSQRARSQERSVQMGQIAKQSLIDETGLQLLRTESSEALMQMGATWVVRRGFMGPFLARLSHEQAVQYLRENIDSFKRLEVDTVARSELADHALTALGEVRGLLKTLYPDPWTLTSEMPSGRYPSRLQRAMATGSVAAMQVLAQHHQDSIKAGVGTSRLHPGEVVNALMAYDAALTPGLYAAMRLPEAGVVREWGRILKYACAMERSFAERSRARLAGLLEAKSANGLTALASALMTNSHQAVSRVTNIDARVTNIDDRVTNVDNRVTKVEGDITNLRGDVVALRDTTKSMQDGHEGAFQVSEDVKASPKPIGTNSAAAGTNALASGNNALAVGNDTKAIGTNSTALGQGANVAASAANSVALGSNSQASRGGSDAYTAVGVGAGQKSSGEVSVGSAGAERQITNVAPGREGTDAVNVNQLAGVAKELGARMDGQAKDARAGTSAAMAMAAMPQAYIPGKSMLTAGAGTYAGQTAVAVGITRMSDNGLWVSKLGGSVDSRGKVGFSFGVGVHW